MLRNGLLAFLKQENLWFCDIERPSADFRPILCSLYFSVYHPETHLNRFWYNNVVSPAHRNGSKIRHELRRSTKWMITSRGPRIEPWWTPQLVFRVGSNAINITTVVPFLNMRKKSCQYTFYDGIKFHFKKHPLVI